MTTPINYRLSEAPDRSRPLRRGVVGVIIRGQKLLVIRRATTVAAPHLVCFPGGAIEPDETATDALVRELREELTIDVVPVRRIWEVTTGWNVHLTWYLVRESECAEPIPNPAEVAEVLWLSLSQLQQRDDLLGSVPPFIDAIRTQQVQLPGIET